MSLLLKNLSIFIDEKLIVEDVNLSLNKGDVVAILGPNGHGKSTILKSIINHYSINKKGQIFFNQNNITNKSPDEISRLGIFYSLQYPLEIPGITQLDLYKSILNVKAKEPLKISEIYLTISKNLKMLNFNNDILNRAINEGFSGGEKKKNEIMQMLLQDPELILLDEIDSGLDIDTFDNIAKIIVEQKKKGKTIIFISHNQKMVDILKPNKVIVMANGKIIEEGNIQLAKQIFKSGFKKYFNDKNIQLKKESNKKVNETLKGCGVNDVFKNKKNNK